MRGGPSARRRAEGLDEGRGGLAGEGALQGSGVGRVGGRAHLRYQPAVDENDEDVEHRMRDRGWSRNLHVVVRRRSRSASGVGRARLLAVERDLAEARRRRAVDQWNCVGGRGHLLSENMYSRVPNTFKYYRTKNCCQIQQSSRLARP